jgi:hypothetical protein
LVSGDLFKLIGREQRCAAVPPSGVVELVAPGKNDLARFGLGREVVPGQDLVFEGGEERLRSGVVEALTG